MKKRLLTIFGVTALLAFSSCGGATPQPETPQISELDQKRLEIYRLAVEAGYQGSYREWLDSIRGQDGEDGINGEDGVSVESVEKTSSVGLIDIYTITYSDGHTSTFTVTNGQKGDQGEAGPQGPQGPQGEQGIQGNPGADGTSVHTGNGTPSSSLGMVGDSYINLENWDFYVKEESGWVLSGNIKGAQGEQGIQGETGPQGPQGEPGQNGNDGLTPYIGENGNWWIGDNDTGYVAIGHDGATGEQGVQGETGPQGPQGEQGTQGEPGKDGISIVSINLTSSYMNVDTYTITFSDGSTFNYNVTNGVDGTSGTDGQDGYSPYIGENGNWWISSTDTGVRAQGVDAISPFMGNNGNWWCVSWDPSNNTYIAYDTYITAQGPQGEPGKDGVSVVSIAKTDSEGLVDTYTITYSDGHTSTFTVTNGQNGVDGAAGPQGPQGEQGIQGVPGADGHTPVITISDDGYWVVDGEKTSTLAQGPKGDQGEQGIQGEQGVSIVGTHIDGNGDLIIEYSNGTESNAGHLKDNQTCTVRFHVDDEIVATREVLVNTKVSRPTFEETAGYTINDWYYLDGSVRESWKFFGYVVSEDTDLYADFEYNEYTINFVDNKHGHVVDSIDVSYDHEYSLPSLDQTGYTFSCWKDSGGTIWNNGIYRTASSVTLYAVWDANSYTVSLDPNGGSVDSTSITVIYDSSYSLPIPTRLNYIFLGWYDGDTKISNNATWKFSDNKSFTAKWTNVTNTYVFDAGDGTCEVSSMVIGWEDEYELPTPTAPSNDYIFIGWYLDKTFVSQQGLWTYSNSGGILTAQYELRSNYLIIDNNVVTGILSSFPGGHMVVPKGVTSIGDSAFRGCSSLTSITIPDSVTSIGNSAFSGCKSLTSITIPDSVTEIGKSAFFNCSSLTSFAIPNSVTSIGKGAFDLCASIIILCKAKSKPIGWDSQWNLYDYPVLWGYDEITKRNGYTYVTKGNINTIVDFDDSIVDFNPSLETVGCLINDLHWGIFKKNNKVKTVVIPNGATSIAYNAFYDCSSLITITIPDSVTTIGQYAFYNCTSLTTLNIPNSVTTIGKYAFYNCTSLRSVNLGNGVTSIGERAFYNCTSLRSVNLGNGVSTIEQYAFYNCTSLTTLDIPDSVTTIGQYAFSYCISLYSVIVGKSVASIGVDAFYQCSIIEIINKSSLNIVAENSGYGRVAQQARQVISDESESKLHNDGYFITYVETDKTFLVKYIGNDTRVSIPDGVTIMRRAAFYNCTFLSSIYLNDIVSIGVYAFKGCTSLTELNISYDVTSIGDSAFSGCTSLTKVNIYDYSHTPSSLKSIGFHAFDGCSSLTSIVIPTSVTSIGERAFYGCSSITIYCRWHSKPSGWNSNWSSDRPVVWGYEG